MLDEAVANITCALETNGMADNTIMILVSDNGGEATILGNSDPFVGNKGSFFRGGLSGTGFIHSKWIPEDVRGGTYEGQMHVTDWLPTLMGLATDNDWDGGLFGIDIDGVDQWDAITTLGDSPRSEIVHHHNGSTGSSIQIDMVKLNVGDRYIQLISPEYSFDEDFGSSLVSPTCESPSLMSEESSYFTSSGFSHPLKSATSTKNTPAALKDNTVFTNESFVIMICLLAVLVVMISFRLAHVIHKHEDSDIVDIDIRKKLLRAETRNVDESTNLLA
jgi:hypothetical protein